MNTAEGASTLAGLTVANAPGAWGNGSDDPMYNSYIYPFGGGNGYCKDSCTAADYPYASSGFKACAGWNNVMTVWRQAN